MLHLQHEARLPVRTAGLPKLFSAVVDEEE